MHFPSVSQCKIIKCKKKKKKRLGNKHLGVTAEQQTDSYNSAFLFSGAKLLSKRPFYQS